MKNESLKLFFQQVLIVFAVGGSLAFLLFISNILLLIFGAALLAVILHAISAPIQRHMRISQRWALFTSIMLILAGLLMVSWMMGSIVSHQLQDLGQRLPGSWALFKVKAAEYEFGTEIVHRLENFRKNGMGGFASGLSSAAFSVVDSIANFFVLVVAGIFIAAQPQLYRNGFLKIVPPRTRPQIEEALTATGRALKLWFIGKLISMACIGILASLVFLIVGLPSALALGLLAGVGEFVPFIGSFLALIPAILIASTTGGLELVIWTMAAFFAVQQLQGNLIMPLVQQRMVQLPPALTIFSLVTFTMLFGIGGLLLAEPLTVFFFVLVKKLYIRDTLEEKTRIPGEKKRKAASGG